LKEKNPQNNLQDERRTPSMNFRENICKTLVVLIDNNISNNSK